MNNSDQTIVSVLRRRAEEHPNRKAFSFMAMPEDRPDCITYSELDRKASHIAGRLAKATEFGDRALLMSPQGLEYIVALFGCLYAGRIAVPAFPPHGSRGLRRLQRIAADSGAKVVLGESGARASGRTSIAALWPQMDFLAVYDDPSQPDAPLESLPSSSDVAFLQYTSGSTGAPKGVIVSHANVLHNVTAIAEAFGQTSESSLVCWLPLFHDMGLVGNVLLNVFAGAHCLLVPPGRVMQRPVEWLSAISKTGATTSGGPNFIYDLCVRKVRDEEIDSLDLSNWRVAYNGAEVIRPETIDRFIARFGRCGFRPEAFRPCYGLAESTLLVSVPRQNTTGAVLAVESGRIGCGDPAAGTQIAIVDPETTRLRAVGEVGEIWVSSPSVARGYWNRPDLEQSFRARSVDDAERTYLRTGDLGFIRSGQLFVVDRLKDMIIVRGRNLYAHDAESAVLRSCKDLAPGFGAAFAIEVAGEERLAVVQEVGKTGAEELRQAIVSIRAAIAQEHETAVAAVVLVRSGLAPRTTSGKVIRRECEAFLDPNRTGILAIWREQDEAAQTAPAAEQDPRGVILGWLSSRFLLAPNEIPADAPLVSLGLDSLGAVQLAHHLEQACGVDTDVPFILAGASLDELTPALTRRAIPDEISGNAPSAVGPLSYGQEALYYLQALNPDSAAYNISVGLRVRGDLKQVALRSALEALATKHAALRTTFHEEGGQRLQRVHPSLAADLSWKDGASWPELALDQYLRRASRAPFALDTGPLWRAHVVRRGDDDHVLLFVAHHLIADLWSLSLLLSGLVEFYEAAIRGVSHDESPRAPSFLDRVIAERAFVGGARGERQRAYWLDNLAEETERLKLPAWRDLAAPRTLDGDSARLILGRELSEKVRDLAATLGTTLAASLLAVYQILLWRFSRQDSFRIALAYTGRGDGRFANTVGYFVNLLVIKAGPRPDLSFAEMIIAAQESVMAALSNGGYPYGLLVQEHQRGSAARQELFDAVFVMQSSPHELPAAKFAVAAGEPVTVAGLEFSPLSVETGAAQFDLALTAADVDGRIALELRYGASLFTKSFAESMLAGLKNLLEQVVREPGARVSEARLLAKSSAAVGVSDFAPRADFDSGQTLVSLFERQVALRPGAVAISHGETRVTYAQLNDRANALARRLVEVGVGPESLVVLDPERHPDLVVAMLGVLKAGGAYAPVDQNWPRERLAWLLADARPAAVVTRTLSAFPPLRPEVEVVSVEDVEGESGAAPPGRLVLPDQLAYVIYTSGSTGAPKGCLLTHRNVVRLFEASQEHFQFGPDDTWTMFHSPAFDLSVWEIFGALLYGGRVVIMPYEVTRAPDEFHELLATENVTVLTQTPSAFRQLAAAAARGGRRADRLRYVVFGGERLEPRMVEPWTAVYGFDQPKLVNMYGITETTVHTTHRVFTEGDANLTARSPIGVPLSDLGVRLLDPGMHLQPDGAVGAIFVAGAGVARGYLRRPDLTATRFVPDPFASEPGARLYASGDLAVVSEEAGLEYLAREDQQIKIRGYRIEPGEAQAVIAKHPGVNDCIVLPYVRNGGDQRLVAYFIPKAGCEVAHGELRALAMSRLPEYMVPSVFVALEEWPLTANGKLNRNALPDPALQPWARDAVVAPRTPMEFELAGIFEEVLGVSPVGVEDNYFELGGDSIRSISVRAIAQERGIEFSLRDLVECPTVAALAERSRKVEIREREKALRIDPPPDRQGWPDEIEDAYPLTSVLAGLLFHSLHGDDYESYVTSLHVRSPFDETLLRQSLETVVRRHTILRTTFDTDRYSEPMQLVCREGMVSLQVFDLRGLGDEQQERELAEVFRSLRARRPEWGSLPLARWLVHLRSPGSFQLTLSEPFLDGWSVGLLLTEVLASYRGRLNGAPKADLPPLRAAFRDNVLLERQALASEETRRFWDEQIRDLPACRLPRPQAADEHHGLPIARCEMKVEGPLLDAAIALARRLGVSVKSLLLAAHLKAMSVMTGSQEVVTGLLVNTRPETADGDRVVGLFTSGAPLRVHLPGGETWESLIRKAHQAEARLLPHRRFPFAEMKRLNGGRDLFEAVFNFTHFHIYSDLERASGVEIIDAYASEQTYFDLTAQLHLDRKQTSLVIALDYRVGRFEEATIRQTLAVYDQTLRMMTSRPEAPHDDSCCAPPEDLRFVAGVNRTTRTWEPHTNLCDLIERQVRLTPRAPAARFRGQPLTYAELNARANQVARLLRREGLSKDATAAVMLDRSLDLVVMLLAILKAGAAYLPLDPEHPAERIRRICEDADARLVITASNAKVALQQKVLSIDALMQRAGVESSTNLGINVEPDALAYIIYTSGSTGTPKGAMNTHRGICNRLLWMQRQYGLGCDDRVLQKTPYTFDVSVWEFFWPLIAGACLVVATPESHLDPEYLDQTIRKEAITTMHFVPAMLRNFLAETTGTWPSLRNVICSGEALDRDLAQMWYRRCGAALHNLYGPAEAAVDVTAHRCDPAASGVVPIGKPIANTRIYILDGSLQPVPLGVEGEIFIAGVGVGRGYAGDPRLTGARFLPDLFADEPDARMYRTGDRGRCLSDGSIEFLGRLDGQVKIRGQRIELGEIESALRDIEGVRDAVAALDGKGALVAWVVFKTGAELQSSDLRRLLGERLPRYMLPQQFRFPSELPLNRSGKIDRRLLLDQETARKDLRIEEILARVETLDDRAVQELLAGESTRL